MGKGKYFFNKFRKCILLLCRNIFFLQHVSIYAAYLYDSVKLYAKALDRLIRRDEAFTDEAIFNIAINGTRIIETIINQEHYKSEFDIMKFNL